MLQCHNLVLHLYSGVMTETALPVYQYHVGKWPLEVAHLQPMTALDGCFNTAKWVMTALDVCFSTAQRVMTALDGCFSTSGLGAEWYKRACIIANRHFTLYENGRSDDKSQRG